MHAAMLLVSCFLTFAANGAEEPKLQLPVTGESVPELETFDTLMTDFLHKHKVPGAALAITKDGRLVYARGFGYADVEKKEPVAPGSLFRIASASKRSPSRPCCN
jgi:N-acyl-D-amino-acid deacylase